MGHFSDVVGHVLPRLRSISWTFSISDPQKIAPDVDSPPQVIVLLRKHKEFPRVCASDPPVIDRVKLLILAHYLREALIDQRVRVIKRPEIIIKVNILDTPNRILKYLWNPFLIQLLSPSFIEGLNGKREV